jgi:type II secretory pathway pseudopilin PulG
MSNVLIGIIGVILFIGLALAGALFLGPRFQESTINSKAAASVQALSQMANAANMYRLREGRPFQSGYVQPLADDGYLKTIPTNPADRDGGFDARSSSGGVFDGDAAVIGMGVGEGETGSKICAAIARQAGQTLVGGLAPVVTTYPSNPIGCFKLSQPLGSLPVDVYMAYARI